MHKKATFVSDSVFTAVFFAEIEANSTTNPSDRVQVRKVGPCSANPVSVYNRPVPSVDLKYASNDEQRYHDCVCVCAFVRVFPHFQWHPQKDRKECPL